MSLDLGGYGVSGVREVSVKWANMPFNMSGFVVSKVSEVSGVRGVGIPFHLWRYDVRGGSDVSGIRGTYAFDRWGYEVAEVCIVIEIRGWCALESVKFWGNRSKRSKRNKRGYTLEAKKLRGKQSKRRKRKKRVAMPLNLLGFEVREVSEVSKVSVIRGGKPLSE